MTYYGLTWDHPRGYDALAKAAADANAARPEPLLAWHKQPLEGFESAPIAQLAARYDLLVLDHPHVGEAVTGDCLHPLEDLYSPEQIAAWQAQSVGPSLASYAWQGKIWALPLDVATQVMVRRQDTIAEAPETWEHVLEMARRLPVAQSLAGPHAVLTLFSMVAGMGGTVGRLALMTDEPALQALSIMHQLYERRPEGSDAINPIALLEAMTRGEIDLIPLVFGYVNYARSSAHNRLNFSDTIGLSGPQTGGVLGGTGIGFAKHTTPSQELLDHIAHLMAPQTQRSLIADYGGQPSARSAWQDASVNNHWGGFYENCLRTAENALLRPRFDGYIAFQTQASERLRQALAVREPETKTLAALRELWARATNHISLANQAQARDQMLCL